VHSDLSLLALGEHRLIHADLRGQFGLRHVAAEAQLPNAAADCDLYGLNALSPLCHVRSIRKSS